MQTTSLHMRFVVEIEFVLHSWPTLRWKARFVINDKIPEIYSCVYGSRIWGDVTHKAFFIVSATWTLWDDVDTQNRGIIRQDYPVPN